MDILLTVGAYSGAILAITGVIVGLVRYLLLVPLKNFIREQTYLIQPDSNSGKSLPDIALALESIKIRLDRLERHAEKENYRIT